MNDVRITFLEKKHKVNVSFILIVENVLLILTQNCKIKFNFQVWHVCTMVKSKKFSFAIYIRILTEFKESQLLYLFFPTEKTYSDSSVFLITELIWVVAFYLSDREISRKLSLEERIIEIISLFRMIFCKCLNWFFKLKRLSCLFCSIMAFFFDYNRPFKRRQFL